MNHAPPPPRWYAPWRTAPRRTGAEPADMGTAFGLELTLAVPLPAAPPAASAPPRPAAHWARRLTMNRKPLP